MGATSGRFRTEGGAVIVLDTPLSPVFAGQLRRHELVALDAPTDPDRSAMPQPARSDSKGLWEEYAVSRGMTAADAKASSKAHLIDLHGPTPTD